MDYKLNAYYEDTDDGRIVKLIQVKYFFNDNMATLYDMHIVRKGKYDTKNTGNTMYYLHSAFKRCRKLSKEEQMAIQL